MKLPEDIRLKIEKRIVPELVENGAAGAID